MQTIGEDAFMSTGISNNGWSTAFIPQSLQFGLVPDTYGSHLKQHRRWVGVLLSSCQFLSRYKNTKSQATNHEICRNLVV